MARIKAKADGKKTAHWIQINDVEHLRRMSGAAGEFGQAMWESLCRQQKRYSMAVYWQLATYMLQAGGVDCGARNCKHCRYQRMRG